MARVPVARDGVAQAGGPIRVGVVRQVFATTSGTRVELCDSDAGPVIVKRSEPGAPAVVRESLQAQARQLRALRRVCPRAPCSDLLEWGPDRLVLRYVPGETVRDRADLAEPDRLRLLAQAASTVFALAAETPGAGPPPGAGFIGAEFARRLDRLESSLRHPTRGPALAAALAACDGDGLLTRLRASRAGPLARFDRALAPDRLGLAIHGDLTPQNIVCSPGDRLTLIDVRGMVRWAGGLPWWDPVLDLAASVVFHAAIDPIASAVPAEPAVVDVDAGLAERLAGHLAWVLDEQLERLRGGAGLARWAAIDTRWAQRLVVAVLVRLVGNIAVQVEYGGTGGVRRAGLVYAVAAHWYERLPPIVRGAG